MEKKRVGVQIAGRNYVVITTEAEEYVESVAQDVIAAIRRASQTGRNLDTRDCAMLAALDFCDDRNKAQKRNLELIDKADLIIRKSADLSRQCKEYKDKLAEAINENTALTRRVKALEEQLRGLIRENENLQKQNDGKNPGQEKQFEKTVKEKKTEKMMGYVPMRQYSLFDDKDQSKKS